jgi:hypothetical protein
MADDRIRHAGETALNETECVIRRVSAHGFPAVRFGIHPNDHIGCRSIISSSLSGT